MNSLLKIVRESDYFDLEGKVCVEVGVAMGEWSNLINCCNPKLLWLIDCWEHQKDEVYHEPDFNLEQDKMVVRYHDVVRKFKDCPNVRIVRDYSISATRLFDKESVDFVYIDANHSEDSCYKDIVSWWPIVKIGGCLSGHDINQGGVENAVKRFCNGHQVTYDVLSRCSWGILK